MKDPLMWYQNGHEKLMPLRSCIFTLIEEMETYNRFAKRMKYPFLNKKKIAEAKRALAAVEKFFTNP